MKKIALYQIDGKIPNLALMQIAGYYESKGIEICNYQGALFENEYQEIFASKIFNFSQMPDLPVSANIGGTGIDFYNTLPIEMQNAVPSYSLYPNCNFHLGFSMKGCRFSCKFCCVPKKEGRPRFNSNIDDLLINPKGDNRLMLLDNDFFGSPNWKIDLERIIELNLKICFVQGLNIRIITQEQANLLAKCKYYNSKFKSKSITFAWDKFKDKKLIQKGIEICKHAGIKTYNMQFFVLIGFDSTPDEDLERVMYLKNIGANPFVMPYDKFNNYQNKFARWVNHKAIFKKVKWSEYKGSFKDENYNMQKMW